MNLSDAQLQDLADDLDRFESMLEGQGYEGQELASVAAYWLDVAVTAIRQRKEQ